MRASVGIVGQRELASREVATLREARGWLTRNRETWRGALEDHESSFEMHVTSGDELLLVIRHTKEFGTEGERIAVAPTAPPTRNNGKGRR